MQETRRDGNAAIFGRVFGSTSRNPYEASHNIEFLLSSEFENVSNFLKD